MTGRARAVLDRVLPPLGAGDYGIARWRDLGPALPCRAAARLPEEPRAAIVCLFPYHTGDLAARNLSRYAVVDDYHAVALDILDKAARALKAAFPGGAFPAFADNSPVREVEAARLAGLGDVGRNGQLIHPVWGSWVFIGALVTDLFLTPFRAPGGSCMNCGACVAACPTGALGAAGFRKELCRSHITQKGGALTDWEAEQVRLGGLAWGCDLCLEACPHNRHPRATPIPAFRAAPAPLLTAENLDALHPAKPYNYRKKRVLLRNLGLLAEAAPNHEEKE